MAQALDVLIEIWVLLLGATVGSFLNVVVARLPHDQSIVRPRSRCPSCGTPIAWYDNLPVVSWLVLRARCRACRAPISVRYPLIEILGAGAAWMAWIRHGLSVVALMELIFVAALVALAFIDLDTWLLPNVITWPLVVVGLGASTLHLTTAGGFRPALFGAALGYGVFAAVSLIGRRVFRREAMGWGDVWLLAGLGSWLGMASLLPVVLLASLQGSVIGFALLVIGKGTPGPDEPPAQDSAESSVSVDPATSIPVDPIDSTTTLSPDSASTRTEPPHPLQPEEEEWVPPKNSVPFGPFLVAAALEWLYLAGPITRLIPPLLVFR